MVTYAPRTKEIYAAKAEGRTPVARERVADTPKNLAVAEASVTPHRDKIQTPAQKRKSKAVRDAAKDMGRGHGELNLPIQKRLDLSNMSAPNKDQIAALKTADDELIALEASFPKGQGGDSGSNGSSGTPKFEDEPEFAAKQLELLDGELADGAALVQRREDGMYVKRVVDGEDIELGFRDDTGGIKA
jgi:hypothetical protein